MNAARSGLWVALVLALSGCDDRQAWHAPDFSLARMQEQPRIDPFDEGMAAPPPFTVARRGVEREPRSRDRAFVERGRRAFDTICATCHGIRGDGDAPVARKMLRRRPPSLLAPRIRAMTDDQLIAIVAHGYGFMPSYAYQLDPDAQSATVLYLRALQLAQGVSVASLPPSLAAALAQEAP
jgi:cytochrome c5